MNKRLIYFTNYLKKEYLGMINLLVDSLSSSGTNFDTTDILLITQSDFVEESLEIFKNHNLDVKILSLPLMYENFEIREEDVKKANVLDAAQMRMRLFEWNEIKNYSEILYIDTDVLIDGNLDEVFDACTEDKLYGLQEGRISQEYFGRSLLPPKGKKWPIPYTTTAFSTGVMVFKNSEMIKNLFEKTLLHIKTHLLQKKLLPKCAEQPFLVYNAILDGVHDNQTLKGKVVNNPNPWKGSIGHIISHFPRPIGNPGRKSRRMKRYLRDKRRSSK